MWRRAVCLTIGIVLAIGLLTTSVARVQPGRGEPGPKPWQWGDPDWPAQSKRQISKIEIDQGGLSLCGMGNPERAELRNESSAASGSPHSTCLAIKGLGFEVRLRR